MGKFYIKYKWEQTKPFLNENFGVKVVEIENAEDIDIVIENINEKENVNTIFISNEMASFSSNIFNEYKRDKNIKIIIS